ncbi:hypothetical protein C922_05624, partial [Plasmodium inui San Antonio 1]
DIKGEKGPGSEEQLHQLAESYKDEKGSSLRSNHFRSKTRQLTPWKERAPNVPGQRKCRPAEEMSNQQKQEGCEFKD